MTLRISNIPPVSASEAAEKFKSSVAIKR